MKVMIERGNLARHVATNAMGVVVSMDPPTTCCGYEPCNHSLEKYYTPMARVLWQTGPDAGRESIVWANLLETIDDNPQTTENK